MRGIALNLALLLWLLPVGIGAAEPAMPAAGEAAEAAAEQAKTAGGDGSEAEANEAKSRAQAPTGGASGLIRSVNRSQITIDRIGRRKGTKGATVVLKGHPKVPVSGKKKRWMALRKGDFVTVAWSDTTTPATVRKVVVHPREQHPAMAAALGTNRQLEPTVRKFVGWIKQKTDTGLVALTPGPEPVPGRAERRKPEPGKTMKFVRMEYTTVEMKRGAWEELRKGDRIAVYFGKGRPRPAERIVVLRRGGERPLLPGLATRLFHPDYDRTVKDVDGIGEVPPGTAWEPAISASESGETSEPPETGAVSDGS